jgi:hypothetical protein
MLFAVILLCSINVQPAWCDEKNALRVEHSVNGSNTALGPPHASLLRPRLAMRSSSMRSWCTAISRS